MRTVGTILVAVSIYGMITVDGARANAPKRDHDIVAEDYFSLATLGQCKIAPGGDFVVYAETRWEPPADKRNTDLWVVGTKTKTVRRLTFEKGGDGSPAWSPDGKHIYFTSSRKRGDAEDPPYNGKRQVWRISPGGGEPQAVTRVKDGIRMYELSRDGRMLYYVTADEQVDDDWKDLRKEFKDLTYGHGVTKFSQVWKLDLEHWRTEKLIDEKRVINAMAVSPDQRRIAMLTTPDEELIHNEGWSRVDVWDANSKKVDVISSDGWRSDHPSPYGWLDDISWSDDGGALAFTVSFDGYPTRIYVAEWSGDTSALRELTRPSGVTVIGGTVSWRGGSRHLCLRGEDHARARVYAIHDVKHGSQGKSSVLTPGDVVVSSYGFAPSGAGLVVVLADTTQPGDLFLVDRSGDYERLTKVNPQVDTWKLPQISIVKWKGANGDDVEGILELPPDYEPGTPLPLVVEIHGGPTAATHYRLRFWIYGRTMMAAKGYALLSPNYRGSTGYGDRFLVELIGRENDIEVTDILTGVDAMIERGIADADRLAVMGWSNGGFLTNCLITQTDRFKVASSGAGVLDQVLQWGIEDTPGHVINYMKGLPWSLPEEYRAGSPLYNLHKVRTPTLIHVGEGDARVPAAHSKTLYRALKQYLQIPAELVIYPGEGHGLTKYKHRKAKMQWDLAWFDRYLGETEPPKDDKPTTH